MRYIILHLKKLDWLMIGSAVLLSVIGLISLYSSSFGRGDFLNFKKQAGFFLAGFLLMILLSFFDWRGLRDSYLILILLLICILLLVGLFFTPSIRGIKGWYKIGLFSLDPVEPTKIALIILLAKYFSKRHAEMYKLTHIILSGFYVFIPAVLISLQPNIGSAMILVFLWFGILIISGIKLRHLFVLAVLGLVVLVFLWFFILKDYQKSRVLSFLSPQADPLGASWSQTQAGIAIGSGGFWGQGFLKGSQTQYGFLPEPHTDFIFSAIAEEFGLVGIMVLFILFLIVIFQIMKIAILSYSNFPRLFATGLAIVIISQVFINVSMNLGLLPVIGIALPFVTYGGSGMIFLFTALGIIQSIKVNQ